MPKFGGGGGKRKKIVKIIGLVAEEVSCKLP